MPALKSKPMSQAMGLMEKQRPIQLQEAQTPQESCSSASRLVAFSIPPVLSFFYRERLADDFL
jgi:hypothetical protein